MGTSREITLNEAVATTGRTRSLAPGEVLFHEGDSGSSVYACRSGALKIAVTTPGGRDVVLGLIGPGTVVGEFAAIDGLPRSATVTATEPTVVAIATRDEFLDVLERHPHLAIRLLRSMSNRLRSLTVDLAERADTPAQVRVSRRLLHLVELRSAGSGREVGEVSLAITQHDLAGWIGATREATARALAELRRRGVIRTGRGTITVVDVDRLAAAAAV